jgi:hypothetical protein
MRRDVGKKMRGTMDGDGGAYGYLDMDGWMGALHKIIKWMF